LGHQSTDAPSRVGDHLAVEFESAQGWISGWNLGAKGLYLFRRFLIGEFNIPPGLVSQRSARGQRLVSGATDSPAS
jgi:hypothetical protein